MVLLEVIFIYFLNQNLNVRNENISPKELGEFLLDFEQQTIDRPPSSPSRGGRRSCTAYSDMRTNSGHA